MNEGTDSTAEPASAPDTQVRHEAPGLPQQSRLEKVRKVYVRDLEEGERVHTVFCVTRKARNVGRSGKTYLSLVLTDKTGDIDARIFDGVDQVESTFGVGDYVLVQGEVISFHGKPQVLISSLEHLDPEPIDRKEFAPSQTQHDGKRIVTQIRELVGRVHDPHVKALLLAFLEDSQVVAGLQRSPTKAGQEHGGVLGEHVLSVMRLANRVADHYPMIDRDVLLAGALLHDIGKARDVGAEKGAESIDEDRLVGHLVATSQAIHEKAAQIPNFPRLVEHHLTHLVLSHLGTPEQGSPKVPVTLEAVVLHNIDAMDSSVSSWLELMSKDPNEKWTERSKIYERHLWKGVIPTARNKAPVDGKPRRRNGAERRKIGAQVASVQDARHDVHKSEERREPSLPKDITFKPLGEIASESVQPAPEEDASGSEK